MLGYSGIIYGKTMLVFVFNHGDLLAGMSAPQNLFGILVLSIVLSPAIIS